MSDDPYRRKMMGLNMTQLVLGVAISAATVISLFATYITLPQRVDTVQTGQTNLWSKINKMEDGHTADRELLIRMDEKLKSIQADIIEIKADSKARKQP